MNKILSKIIIEAVLRYKKTQPDGAKKSNEYSKYQLARGWIELKISIWRLFKDLILITVGIFSAGFGLKGFLLPNGFVDGGATGIALLATKVMNWPLWLLLVLVNIPFVLLGNRVIDWQFAAKTALAIAGLAMVTALVSFPVVTHEKVLVAVFGGFLLGTGIGLAVRGGAVIDGTEVLAIFLGRLTGLTMGDVILALNIVIFSVAAYLLGMEMAMYSVLTYLSAAKTVDFIVEGIEEYVGMTIISPKSKQIKWMIVDKFGRGVTVYSGKKGIGKSGQKEDIDILFTVITRLEVGRMQAEIDKIDPNAFVVRHSIQDTRGGMIKKRRLAH